MRRFALLFVAACSSGGANEFADAGSADAAHADVTIPDAARDAPVSDDVSTDDGACQLPVNTQVLACNECLQASCCDAFEACAQDTECAALNDCTVACASGELPNDGGSFDPHGDAGTKACTDACATAHASGAAKFGAQESCAVAHCGPSADDGGGGSGACAQ